MATSLARRLAAAGAVSLICGSSLLVPGSATAASALHCRAGVSDSTPRQYSTVYVGVTTSPNAAVTTVAHYRTTSTTHTGRANTSGRASISYYISGSTPGYRVQVSVTVTKDGHRAYCSTSFVAHS